MSVEKTILILSTPRDVHALAVAEALRLKGAEVLQWYPSDFPTHSKESFFFGSNVSRIEISGPGVLLRSPRVDAVWHRRIGSNSDFKALHPADHLFSGVQRQHFRDGSLRAAFRQAFWVNPPDAARSADNKLYQHAVAQKIGLPMPDALYTNDPEEVRRFLAAHDGTIIYKPFAATAWNDGETTWACHTITVTEDDLVEDEILMATPGIYQALVEKSHEVRLTMIGGRPFGARVLSQQTRAGKVDWRRAYDELAFEPLEVPPTIVQLCNQLMSELGLVFGCFDFIVNPQGEYIFLEVNQQGQFLFIEDFSRLPLLDAFSEFLLQGSVDFEYSSREPVVRYSDIRADIERRVEETSPNHAPAGAPVASE